MTRKAWPSSVCSWHCAAVAAAACAARGRSQRHMSKLCSLDVAGNLEKGALGSGASKQGRCRMFVTWLEKKTKKLPVGADCSTAADAQNHHR